MDTEENSNPVNTVTALSAGDLLREAREAQGLSLDALAANLRVPVAKLAALEAGRHDAMPDATFVRALALAVARALRMDAAPVLAKLPQTNAPALDRVSEGINEPFVDKARPFGDGLTSSALASPVVWGPLLILLLAALILFLPTDWTARTEVMPAASQPASAPDVAPAASAAEALPAVAPASVAATTTLPTTATPVTAASDAAVGGASAKGTTSEVTPPQAPPTLTAARPLEIVAKQESWIEIQDGAGQVLQTRHLQAGEVWNPEFSLPLMIKIGNAGGTEVRLNGELLSLAAVTRGNVARLSVK